MSVLNLSQESKKQIVIDELNRLGIMDLRGKKLDEFDYYTLSTVLTAAQIDYESEANKWF